MTGWTFAWLLWGLAFVVIEGLALWNDRDTRTEVDTLSQHVWGWFGIRRSKADPDAGRFVKLRRLTLLTFMVWLTAHFLTGGWV